jgi:signal transduction histidine kinase
MHPDDASPAARMRALAQLARPTAHELRGALGSMTMHLELLAGVLDQEDGALARTHGQRYLAVLREECGRLQRVADAFLALAAPGGTGETDLSALVAGVVDAVRPLALGRRVRLELTECAPLLHELPDREASRQRLLDAVLDAINRARAGAVVRLDLVPAGHRVRVAVGDGVPLDLPLLASPEHGDA